MTGAERVDHLIKTLEGNNAKRFADRTGINTSSLCHLRKGRSRLDNYVDRICLAYPQVNREWLVSGLGNSGIDIRQKTSEEYEREIRRLNDLVRVLSREIKQNQEVIGRLLNH